jgi:hypothetical protein
VLNVRGGVDILLFPVKLSWCRRVALHVGSRLGLLGFVGCGYHSLTSAAASERLCVLAAPAKVPDFGAVQGVLDGAREELARHAELGESGVYPCLVIEVLRVDEAASGVGIAELGGAERPRARGTAVGVVARAGVQQSADAPLSRDTGDLRRVARLEATSGPLEGARHDRGLESAAQELGRALVRRMLGLPTPGDELP